MQTSLLIVAVVAAFAHAADPVQVGGVCGGGTADAPVCDPMLDCVLQSNAPGSTGICAVKVSEAGGPCQQNHFNSAVCKSGLICVKQTQPADGIPRPGGSGMCQFTPDSYVPVGGVCGGGTATSPICESGLVCSVQDPSDIKAQGICSRRMVDVGESCQPSVQNSATCKAGLVCVMPTNPLPGGIGTCQSVATATTDAAAATTTAAAVATSAVATKSVVTTAPAAPTSIKSAALVVEGISATVLSVVISLFL